MRPLLVLTPNRRHHLSRYLEWARNVPDARLEVVLSTLQGSFGDQRPRARDPPAAAAAAAWGAPSVLSPAGAAAAAPGGAARSGSGSPRSGSVRVTVAVAEAPAAEVAAAAVLACSAQDAAATAGSHLASLGDLKASGGGGSGAAAFAAVSPLSPCLSPTVAGEVPLLATLSAASSVATTPRTGAGLAQEQMEGMRRLRGLKSRLQLSADGSGALGSPGCVYGLAKAMSLDSESTAAH